MSHVCTNSVLVCGCVRLDKYRRDTRWYGVLCLWRWCWQLPCRLLPRKQHVHQVSCEFQFARGKYIVDCMHLQRWVFRPRRGLLFFLRCWKVQITDRTPALRPLPARNVLLRGWCCLRIYLRQLSHCSRSIFTGSATAAATAAIVIIACLVGQPHVQALCPELHTPAVA